jgi:hypothetical protein
MAYLFYVVLIALIGFTIAALLVNTSPTGLAKGLRWGLPAILAVAGVGLILLGRASVGSLLVFAASTLFARWRGVGKMASSGQGRRSTVRSAAIEMTLDHDTGALDGIILAGTHEGKRLDDLVESELIDLHGELRSDSESRQLLEAYLDSKVSGWRDHTKADTGEGLGSAPGSGPMTEQEAYQILGLEPGAGSSDIRKAHRRLMQRMHPDVGGSSFLAARINAAKDVLLARHG